MAPNSKSGVPITDFMGLVTNQGNIATDEAAMTSAKQVNLRCVATGEISTRPGLRPVEFDEDSETP